MAGDPEMQQLNRTLKEISHSLKQLDRIMFTLNSNLVELVKALTPPETEETNE